MLAPVAFGTLHYDLIGPDNALIVCMLHSLTSDCGMWSDQVPDLLAAGFQILRLDMRGHGGSHAPDGDYRIEDLAADVLAVLDRLAIDSVHLVGLSIGGMIGQVLAADHPRRIKSLTACATTSRWTGDTAMMRRRLDLVRATGTLEGIVDDAMQQRYSPIVMERRPARWRALRDSFLGTSLHGYLGCMHAVLNHDVSQRLRRVSAPTLVISGSDDPVTPPEAGREIASLVENASYVEIARGRHLLNVEFANEVNPLLLDWLSSLTA
ncbi:MULTISPECIES: alpha/beta fold hydrolase [unclassified Chelatococcus]|uniref:alpha/beta fold hydrolase n=1 Tax=unclassified Chelatococcus TaxID=2638111 RepID=UPI001BCA6DB9|nr:MULTISPECIES: alpha/beta fold hydrolase [unclassified Chelatococcus]MBS7700175.1 alpha/beta fold hydrolase [Chelatococcus sp. YT9]MBX3556868.1 alpha/beta fold hydrolase [Chelatococcus sp.]